VTCAGFGYPAGSFGGAFSAGARHFTRGVAIPPAKAPVTPAAATTRDPRSATPSARPTPPETQSPAKNTKSTHAPPADPARVTTPRSGRVVPPALRQRSEWTRDAGPLRRPAFGVLVVEVGNEEAVVAACQRVVVRVAVEAVADRLRRRVRADLRDDLRRRHPGAGAGQVRVADAVGDRPCHVRARHARPREDGGAA